MATFSFQAIINSPIGKLGLLTNKEHLIGIQFLPIDSALLTPTCPISHITAQQLNDYFTGKIKQFDLPLHASVSAFQQQVLKALQQIPYGKTLTYGELAKLIKSAPRAVGSACRRNPLPIVIPCHRIVAQTHLGGYNGAIAGTLVDIKSSLLQLEARYSH